MTEDSAGNGLTAVSVLQASYAEGLNDEFVLPVRLAPGAVAPGDGVIFFNFRPDRARQLTQAFVSSNFDGFSREANSAIVFRDFYPIRFRITCFCGLCTAKSE